MFAEYEGGFPQELAQWQVLWAFFFALGTVGAVRRVGLGGDLLPVLLLDLVVPPQHVELVVESQDIGYLHSLGARHAVPARCAPDEAQSPT